MMKTKTEAPLAGGVLLGQGKLYVCPQGHEIRGTGPFKMVLPLNPQQVLQSPPCCPTCFLDWCGATFPLTEQVAAPVLEVP